MHPYYIPATKSSPEINFDPNADKLEIRGESYPENCSQFYTPVFEWLEQYLNNTNAPIHLDMEIQYFNSSSSKALMDLFDMLDEAAGKGKSVFVNWHYHEDNETAQECGEEFQEDVLHLDFKLTSFNA